MDKVDLYVSSHCGPCLAVMDYLLDVDTKNINIHWVKYSIDRQSLKHTSTINGRDIVGLPGVPALVHGGNVILGLKIIDYLKDNKII